MAPDPKSDYSNIVVFLDGRVRQMQIQRVEFRALEEDAEPLRCGDSNATRSARSQATSSVMSSSRKNMLRSRTASRLDRARRRPLTLLTLEGQIVLQAIAKQVAKELLDRRRSAEGRSVFSN